MFMLMLLFFSFSQTSQIRIIQSSLWQFYKGMFIAVV